MASRPRHVIQFLYLLSLYIISCWLALKTEANVHTVNLDTCSSNSKTQSDDRGVCVWGSVLTDPCLRICEYKTYSHPSRVHE